MGFVQITGKKVKFCSAW